MLLITGATGYIGQKLLQQFKLGQPLAVLTRSIQKVPQSLSNTMLIEGDLLDPETLQGKFDKVTAVIHLASVTHAQTQSEYWQANVEGTRNLLDTLPSTVDTFIYASTNCAVSGAGAYGESKLVAEQLILEKYPQATILRIADVFGGQGEKSLEKLFNLCKKLPILPIVGRGNYKMAPVHVDDVIAVMVRFFETKMMSGTWIVAGNEVYTFSQLVKLIGQFLKKNIIVIPVPIWFFKLVFTVLASLHIGKFSPDQVSRLTVPKDVDAQKLWSQLKLQPKSFTEWVKRELQQ